MKWNPVNALLDIMYPDLCLGCGRELIKAEKHICLFCLHEFPKTNYHLQPNNPAEERFWGKVPVYRATSFFLYNKESYSRQFVLSLKYRGSKELAYKMGEMAGEDLLASPDFASVDVIIPVPLHPKKLKKRGYNQCEWIAMGLGSMMKKNVNTTNLVRVKHTATQTTKGVYERYTNTKDIFALRDKNLFCGKHILLVDDVLTTGSTLEACCHPLLQTENIKISIFTLAIA